MLQNSEELTRNSRYHHNNPRASTVSLFFEQYRSALDRALSTVSMNALEEVVKILKAAAVAGKTVYVLGNGGSSSIADHLCCDFTKGTAAPHQPFIKTHSLTANTALLTALANDISYEAVFSEQLKMLANPGDVLIAISSSGNSPNVARAVRTAQEIGLRVIGLSGFSGGILRDTADVNLHVAAENYGLSEDTHQLLMHVIAQFLFQSREC